MFAAALFITDKCINNQNAHLLMNDKQNVAHPPNDISSVIRRNEYCYMVQCLWVGLDNNILSERSQTQKDPYWRIPFGRHVRQAIRGWKGDPGLPGPGEERRADC